MNDNEEKCQFLTRDCNDVFIDEPGDQTVEPIPPKRLEQAKALRDQILAAEAAEKAARPDARKGRPRERK